LRRDRRLANRHSVDFRDEGCYRADKIGYEQIKFDTEREPP